jgi:hypothetical protein
MQRSKKIFRKLLREGGRAVTEESLHTAHQLLGKKLQLRK